jgi:hypothetical protein
MFPKPPAKSILFGLLLVGSASASSQLLVSEAADGIHRICTYSGGVSGERRQSYRVGLGQNCPGTQPVADRLRPVPPTAALSQQSLEGGRRTCIYSEGRENWQFSLPLDRYCPLTAGLVDR